MVRFFWWQDLHTWWCISIQAPPKFSFLSSLRWWERWPGSLLFVWSRFPQIRLALYIVLCFYYWAWERSMEGLSSNYCTCKKRSIYHHRNYTVQMHSHPHVAPNSGFGSILLPFRPLLPAPPSLTSSWLTTLVWCVINFSLFLTLQSLT